MRFDRKSESERDLSVRVGVRRRPFAAPPGPPLAFQIGMSLCEGTREKLDDRRLTIAEIAHACGFASSQHRATVSQKKLGTTPSAWRCEQLS